MVTYGGGKHTFTITVNLRGAGADYSSDMVPQVIKAYDLHSALEQALALPFPVWFPAEDDAPFVLIPEETTDGD